MVFVIVACIFELKKTPKDSIHWSNRSFAVYLGHGDVAFAAAVAARITRMAGIVGISSNYRSQTEASCAPSDAELLVATACRNSFSRANLAGSSFSWTQNIKIKILFVSLCGFFWFLGAVEDGRIESVGAIFSEDPFCAREPNRSTRAA